MRKAVTLAPREMVVIDGEPPLVGPGDARVRVDAVGLCGSDYHLYFGSHPYASYPQTQGHEIAGTVLELPSDYHGAAKVGDRVAVEPLVACGHCVACAKGRYNACVRLHVMGAHMAGALADEIAVRADALHPVGDLGAELTALVEPISIGLQAVVRGRVDQGQRVVVLGAGPIGLAATLAAADRGAAAIVVDRVPERLDRARAMGAVATTDAAGLADALDTMTAGAGADVVIDATGVPEMIRLAVDVVAHAGVVVVVGISERDVALPIIDFTRKEIDLLGSRNNTGLFPAAIELVRRHPERVASWVTHRVPLDGVPSAIEYAAEHPDKVEKMIVEMRSTT